MATNWTACAVSSFAAPSQACQRSATPAISAKSAEEEKLIKGLKVPGPSTQKPPAEAWTVRAKNQMSLIFVRTLASMIMTISRKAVLKKKPIAVKVVPSALWTMSAQHAKTATRYKMVYATSANKDTTQSSASAKAALQNNARTARLHICVRCVSMEIDPSKDIIVLNLDHSVQPKMESQPV